MFLFKTWRLAAQCEARVCDLHILRLGMISLTGLQPFFSAEGSCVRGKTLLTLKFIFSASSWIIPCLRWIERNLHQDVAATSVVVSFLLSPLLAGFFEHVGDDRDSPGDW